MAVEEDVAFVSVTRTRRYASTAGVRMTVLPPTLTRCPTCVRSLLIRPEPLRACPLSVDYESTMFY
jgi:hypothetical protein